MPAIHCGKQWNVGTDDFALPALVAVFVRLVSIGLTVGVLIYLFVRPEGCPEPEQIPPFLYGSLFFLVFILFFAILNENIIFSISLRGSIVKKQEKRRYLLTWFFVRAIFIIVELLSLIACTLAVFGPAPYAAGALQCPEFHDGPLVFARVVVVVMLVVIFIYTIGSAIFVDPLGVFSSRFGWKKILRRLFCLNANNDRSRSTAMQEMARAFQTVSINRDMVTSDFVAGLILLSRWQNRERKKFYKKRDMEGFYLHRTFSELTFNYMPEQQKPEDFRKKGKDKMRDLNPAENRTEMELLDNLVHYMKYAMGIYGWTLHVFDNPCCGICQICSVTCCKCNCSCWHPMARATDDDIPIVNQDDCCMSGLGTIGLQTGIPESDVLYISYRNDVYIPPFSICADRGNSKIVLTVRGTLSLKDALTDVSVTMMKMKAEDYDKNAKGSQSVHKGMYESAQHILDEIREKRLLSREFEKEEFKNYGLVLTGHSLGAGVVSVLSVILKREYEDRDLKCYAFSPPGCIFSFPLAWYSRSFITSVVLGNDIIPRITCQSLLYLKWQINNLLQKCEQSKFQVLFRPRFLDRLPQPILDCLFKTPDNHHMDEHVDFHRQMSEPQERRQSEQADYDEGVNPARRRWKKLKKAILRYDEEEDNYIFGFVKAMVVGRKVAAFPPGKIVHLHIKSSKPWPLHYCYPDKLEMRYVNGEDLAVIIIDRGMIDDHLPNKVLSALRRCQREARGSVTLQEEAPRDNPDLDRARERGGGGGGDSSAAVPVETMEIGLGEQMKMTGKKASYDVTIEIEEANL